MISNRSKNRGFTFVEVLVALVIIAVGVAGLVSLQRMFIQSSTRAAERTAAMELAQEKIEELRFIEYANLATGTDTVDREGKTFSLDWTVADRYWSAGGWVTAADPNAPDPLPPEADTKLVTVSVAWTERAGDAESLDMEAWFSKIESRDGGLVVTQPNPRQQPSVTYNPGAAPEVIAVRLTEDDNAAAYQVKETTKPTPEVMRRGDKLQVSFDTVTYNEATQTQRIEDFVTVNCSCQMVGTAETGKTPARLILEGDYLVLDPNGSQTTRKTIGQVADQDQPELCDICCRDHHDSNEMANAGNVYRPESSFFRILNGGNHRHFRNVNGILYPAGNGDLYDESCRLRRVDGYYVLYPDWQLESLTVMSSDYLVNAATSGAYVDYVREAVKAAVLGQALPAAPDDRDVEVVPGAYQMIARAIYLDDMTQSHETTVIDAIQNGDEDWISKVPFYEVNLTLLADWESSNPSVATVDNEDIETIVDPENNYYGVYSRGLVITESGGTTTINTSAREGNASILDSQPTHPNESGQFQSELDVTVVASDNDDVALYAITGDINCTAYSKNKGWQDCKNPDLNGISITTSNNNVVCNVNRLGNNATYSCDGIRAGTSLSVTFLHSSGTATYTPPSFTVSAISADVRQDTLLEIN
jgi:prepilin-type N-terminal cleavage/methylation domain-containing protein